MRLLIPTLCFFLLLGIFPQALMAGDNSIIGQRTGSLEVHCFPSWEAKVFLMGQKLGKTPINIEEFPVGEYKLEFHFQDIVLKEKIEIDEGINIWQADFTLDPPEIVEMFEVALEKPAPLAEGFLSKLKEITP